jgi:hypothetical protein
MKPVTHFLFISIMVLILIATIGYLIYSGYAYYGTSLEERFYHLDHENLKPNGLLGHGMGIIGSSAMVFGVSI